VKATLRKSGEMRFRISVKFHPGRTELINAVSGDVSSESMPKTRAGVIKVLRKSLLIYGRTAGYTGEEDIDNGKALEMAAALIDRLFPELTVKK
jgi:hypothetical protein